MTRGELNEKINDLVYKQLKRLDGISGYSDNKTIIEAANAMANLIRALSPQSLSFYEAETHHPYVVQLPTKDLVDLYAARAELLHQRGESHRK